MSDNRRRDGCFDELFEDLEKDIKRVLHDINEIQKIEHVIKDCGKVEHDLKEVLKMLDRFCCRDRYDHRDD